MTSAETVSGGEAAFWQRFRALCDRLGLSARAAPLRAEVERRYAEPHRAYHTLSHIGACLEVFDSVRDLARDADLVEFAIWTHDLIYDPRRDDNERRSGEWARRALLDGGLSSERAFAVHALIVATAHLAPPADPDAQLLCDIDLTILGASPAQFDDYERRIRAEYSWVPAPIFRARRAEILARFLERPELFATAHFRDRYETRARENLGRSLTALRGEAAAD